MNHNLFSVGLYKTKLNLNVNNIVKYLKNLKKKDSGRNISNPKNMGWQSNDIDAVIFSSFIKERRLCRITRTIKTTPIRIYEHYVFMWYC